jgi:hypothetical protein
MCIAPTPAAAYSRTVRTTLSSFPKPVSASAITGRSTAAAIRAALAAISDMVSSQQPGSERLAECSIPREGATHAA